MTPLQDSQVLAEVAPHGNEFLSSLLDATGEPAEPAVAVSESPTPVDDATPPEPSDATDDQPAPTADAESPPDADDEAEPDDTPTTDPVAAFRDIATKDGKPFTYTVDGQSRTFEGIVDLGDKGAYVPPEALNALRSQFSLASKSIEDNRQLYAVRQELDHLGGFDKMEQMHRQIKQLDAAGSLLLGLLDNPQEMAGLLRQDAQGNVTIDPNAKDFLLRRLDVETKSAGFAAKDEWQTQRNGYHEQQSSGSQREAALQQGIAMLGEGLADADKQAAMQFFAPFADKLFRKATQADVTQFPQMGWQVGQWLLDTSLMNPWFETRKQAMVQTQAGEAKKAQAAKENAVRAQAPVAPKVPEPARNPKNGQFKRPKNTPPEKAPKRTRHDLLRMALRGESLAD